MNKLEIEDTYIRVGAGVDNSAVSTIALENKLSGISWIHRLPGSIGGTVRMNARCYGGEISQVVTEVVTVSLDGSIKHTPVVKMYLEDIKILSLWIMVTLFVKHLLN